MSAKLKRLATNKTRFQGAEFLALYALANNADDDGFYWPTLNVEDAYAQDSYVYDMIRALEQAGEIVILGSDPVARLWVAIAFTPREMKEIAIRRLHMTGEDAIAFVSGDVSRQIN